MSKVGDVTELELPKYLDNSIPKLPFMMLSGVTYRKFIWPFMKEKLGLGFTWKPYQLKTAGWELSRFSKIFFSKYAKNIVGPNAKSVQEDGGIIKPKMMKTTENMENFKKYIMEVAPFEVDKLWSTQKSLLEDGNEKQQYRPRFILAFHRRIPIVSSSGTKVPSKEMTKYITERPYKLSQVKEIINGPGSPISIKDHFIRIGQQDLRAWRVSSYRASFIEEQGYMACSSQELKGRVGAWIDSFWL